MEVKVMNEDEVKELLEKLKEIRGRHTELVSVYIPAGHNINEIKNMIAKEISTAENIKSKTTRNNVIDALSKIANALKYYRETPETGLVIFSGNISQREGEQDIKIWEVVPPKPVPIKLYRCDQVFVTQPLEEMFEDKDVYGIIAIDRQEAAIGFLRGKSIEVVKKIESMVPGKTAKGGQSAARFMRVREGLLLAFEKEVGEVATEIFKGEKNLKGILIGGPGPLKYEFAEGDYLPFELKKKIIKVIDTGYAGEEGIREVIARAEDVLKESAYLEEKSIVDKFFKMLKKDDELVVYGLRDTLNALEMGALDSLLLSEHAPFIAIKYKCKQCGYEGVLVRLKKDASLPIKCESCGSEEVEKEEMSVKKYLKERAELYGTSFYLISEDSPEGKQFTMFSGIGGILRYKLK